MQSCDGTLLQAKYECPQGQRQEKNMNKVVLAFLATAAALAITPAAIADTYSYTFTAGSLTATGTLNVDSLGGGEDGILGGTITITGGGVISGTGVILADPNSPGTEYTFQNPGLYSGGANYTIDNLFFPGGAPQLDDDGFAYELNDGIYGNIWGNSPNNYQIVSVDSAESVYFDESGGNFATTPEPGTLLLLGTGLLGLAFVAFRKVKTSGTTLSI